MQKNVLLGAIAALGMSSAAFAAEEVSHSFIEGSYGYAELGGGAIADGDGFRVAGSFELPANFIVAAGFRDFDFDGTSIKETSAGLGYKWAVGSQFDLVTGASFEQLDYGTKFNGFALNLGLRGLLTETLEISAGLGYHDWESDSGLPTYFAATMGVKHYFTPNFAAGVDIRKGEFEAIGETSFLATLRYDFGSAF